MTEIEKKTKELKKRLKSSVLTKDWLERTIISLGLYGMISGTIGPFYITNVNGRMIIRLRAKDFHMSMTEASIANRNNMASATKFAMFLKSINCIYKVWKTAKIEGTNPFTRLIKHNKKHLINDCPSQRNMITPEGFELYIEDIISVEKDGKIKVSKDYCFNENEQMVIAMIALDPKKKKSNDYECIELNSSSVKAGQVIELKQWQKEVCRNYKKFIIYTALIRQSGKKFQWSNTCILETEFDFGVDYKEAGFMGYGQIQPEVYSYSSALVLNISSVQDLVIRPPG